MRSAKYGLTLVGFFLLAVGCTASGMDDGGALAGSGQPSFGNAAGQAAPAAPRMAGGAGSSALPMQQQPSAGAAAPQQASAGSGSPGGSGGPFAAGMSSGPAGMSGGAGMGASAGSGDEEWPEWPVDEGMPATPPDPAMCADAFCFDIFDCYIFNLDKIDCGFTDCVDFVCK